MTASFTITLDTTPPAVPTLRIADGASRTADQVVAVQIGTGSADVDLARVWGDVDPAADPRIQPAEVDSAWMAYDPAPFAVQLSAGTGRKRLYARLADDVGNATATLTAFVDFDASLPRVTVTEPVTRARLSLVSGYDATSFGWQSSVSFTRYEVRLVPTVHAPHTAGPLLEAAEGTYPATTTRTTTLTAAQIRAAAPGDGPRIVKVFVRAEGSGTWSA